MKKIILVTTVVMVALAILGVGIVFAQGSQPPVQRNGYGWMHEYIEQALAAKLDLTEAQVEEQLAAGSTMYQIALDNGVAQDDVVAFLNDVHAGAFANAVKDGVMTQQQVDWMLQHMQNRGSAGTGGCPMHNGQNTFGNGNGFGPGMMRGQGFQNQTNP